MSWPITESSTLIFYSFMVTIFPSGLTINKLYRFCKQRICTFCIYFEQKELSSCTILTSFYNGDCVYCAVRSGSLHIIQVIFRLRRVNNVQVWRARPLSNVFGVYFMFYFNLQTYPEVYIRHCILSNELKKNIISVW
jgi:hypothetical protein